MAMWDTTDFLTRVKRKAQWPTNPKLPDASILAVADEELSSFLAPIVRGVSEAYWVKRYTVAITAGQPLYRIPARATSGTVFDVALLDSNGNDLARLNKIQAADAYGYVFQSGPPQAYFIEADQIRLLPTPGSGYTLRVRYERRPSQLVSTSVCGLVTHVTSSTVLKSATRVTGCAFDLAQSLPNFDALYDSYAATVAGAGPYVYTFTDTISQVVCGDYICPTGTTCIVPVPDGLYSTFIDRVASECLDEAGDAAGADRIRAQTERKLDGVIETLTPRAETSAQSAFNRRSPMRGG